MLSARQAALLLAAIPAAALTACAALTPKPSDPDLPVVEAKPGARPERVREVQAAARVAVQALRRMGFQTDPARVTVRLLPSAGNPAPPPSGPPAEDGVDLAAGSAASAVCRLLAVRTLRAESRGASAQIRWLEEGIGGYVEWRHCLGYGFPSAPGPALGLAALASSRRWDRLDEEQRTRGYLQMVGVVWRLADLAGEERLGQLARDLGEKGLAEALKRNAGTGVDALQGWLVDRHGRPPKSLSTEHAVLEVEPGVDPSRVEAVVAAYETAWGRLAAVALQVPEPPVLHIYRTREPFLADLTRAGLDGAVEAFRRSGAPRPWNGHFFVPPDMLVFNVCHELTHLFIEARSGRAYRGAKWLDEGLASHMASVACGAPAPSLPATGLRVPLGELATEAQWGARFAAQKALIYGQAHLAVASLAARYGEARLFDLVGALRDRPLDEALREVVGLEVADVERLAEQAIPAR